MSAIKPHVRELVLRKKIENKGTSHNDIAKTLKMVKSSLTVILKSNSDSLSLRRKNSSGRKQLFESPITQNVIRFFKVNKALNCNNNQHILVKKRAQ